MPEKDKQVKIQQKPHLGKLSLKGDDLILPCIQMKDVWQLKAGWDHHSLLHILDGVI